VERDLVAHVLFVGRVRLKSSKQALTRLGKTRGIWGSDEVLLTRRVYKALTVLGIQHRLGAASFGKGGYGWTGVVMDELQAGGGGLLSALIIWR
jgi:hypothetical protein